MAGSTIVLEDVDVFAGPRRATVRIGPAGAVLGEPGRYETGDRVFRCSGALLTPGLADIHVHAYRGATYWGVPLAGHSAASGVTTVVDAGSAGAYTFSGLSAQLRTMQGCTGHALVNISGIGLAGPADEHASQRLLSVTDTVECIRKFRDQVVGVKVRLNCDSVAGNASVALSRALEVAAATGLPMMVDFGAPPPRLDELLGELRPGDVLTHCFIGGPNRLSAPEWAGPLRSALDRGVLLDVGHGAGSFNFDVAEAMIGAGIAPHTISSDLHRDSVFGPAFDLLTVASKLLVSGMPLDDAIEAMTRAPRDALALPRSNWPDDLGADLALLRLGADCAFTDVDGNIRTGPLVECLLTVHRGSVSHQSPRLGSHGLGAEAAESRAL